MVFQNEKTSLTGGLGDRGMCGHVEIFHLTDQVFSGTPHCVTKRGAERGADVSYRSNEKMLASVTG